VLTSHITKRPKRLRRIVVLPFIGGKTRSLGSCSGLLFWCISAARFPDFRNMGPGKPGGSRPGSGRWKGAAPGLVISGAENTYQNRPKTAWLSGKQAQKKWDKNAFSSQIRTSRGAFYRGWPIALDGRLCNACFRLQFQQACP